MFYWINTVTLVTLAHLSDSFLKHKLIYRNVYLLLSPTESCSLLTPNSLSHQPQNNSWRFSMHFPKGQMINLFFVYCFFSQYSSIEESQSQSPLFPSSHPPYPGHDKLLFILSPKLTSSCLSFYTSNASPQPGNHYVLPELGQETPPGSPHLPTPSS